MGSNLILIFIYVCGRGRKHSKIVCTALCVQVFRSARTSATLHCSVIREETAEVLDHSGGVAAGKDL